MFGDAITETIHKQVWFGSVVVHGHLLKKVGKKKQLFPAEWEQQDLKSKPDEAFGQCAKDAWRDIQGREASLT